MCGKLLKSLYGTRDAATKWSDAYTEILINAGFRCGTSNPCLFFHPKKEIYIVVHGDDFTFLRTDEELNRAQSMMQAEFEVKIRGRRGPEKTDDESIKILDRRVTWRTQALKMNATRVTPSSSSKASIFPSMAEAASQLQEAKLNNLRTTSRSMPISIAREGATISTSTCTKG